MKNTIFYPKNPMLDDMVREFFGNVFVDKKANNKYPLTNVYIKDGVVHLEIAVAGFSKEDIEIELNDDILTISANRENEDFNDGREYMKRDIARRNFKVSYSIMSQVESIDASIVDGILQVSVNPKTVKKEIKKIELK